MSKILIMYGDECATPPLDSRQEKPGKIIPGGVDAQRGRHGDETAQRRQKRPIPVTRDGQQVGDLYHRPFPVAGPTIPGGESAHHIRLVDGERDPGEAVEKLFRRRGEGDASSGQGTVLATGPGVVDLTHGVEVLYAGTAGPYRLRWCHGRQRLGPHFH